MIIYCITSPSGKRYIGQTKVSLERRWYMHKWFAKHGEGYLLAAAIRKYGEDKFLCEVLAQASNQAELDKLEQDYIQKFQTMDSTKGYNLVLGGEGGVGWWAGKKRKPISPEHAEKLHAGRRNTPVTAKQRKQIGDRHRGKTYSPEVRQKISASLTGKRLSAKSIEKRSQTLTANHNFEMAETFRIVRELHDGGWSNTDIAAQLGFHRKTIARWLK